MAESVAESKSVSTKKKSWLNKDLLAILLAAVFVRLPWIFTVPMAEAPDEFAHYWVIKFLREHMRLPNYAEVIAGGPSAVYGSMPQIGYLPHVLMTLPFPLSELTLYERFGSLFCGLITIAFAYYIGKELFRRSRLYALAVPALLVFHPQLVLVHSYANNDSTTSAIATAILYLMVITLKQGITLKRSATIGALLGFIALCKYSGVALIPTVGLFMVAASLIHGTSISLLLSSLATMGGLFVLLSAWWFIRNAHEFAGDILGTQTMYKTWATTFHRDLNYYLSPWHIIKDRRWWRTVLFSFWGMFGYMNRYLWRPIYYIYLGYMVAAFTGLIDGLTKLSKIAWTKENKIKLATWSMLAIVIIVNLAAMIWASTKNLGGPQGRYLFACEVPIAAFLIQGLSKLPPSINTKLIVSLLIFNAIICLGAFAMLAPIYGFHSRPY